MRTFIFFLIIVCGAFTAYGQQQPFSNISLHNMDHREIISFTVPREINIRHYRIEASNDSINFEIVTTFPSKGNSMLARTYHYDLCGYSYIYYRIGMVLMNSDLLYSIVTKVKNELHEQPATKALSKSSPQSAAVFYDTLENRQYYIRPIK